MPKKSQFSDENPVTRELVLDLLAARDPARRADLQTALVAMALNDDDLRFAYETVVRAALLKDEQVRGTAIVCLGHLARIHETLPDDRAIAIVQQGLSDASEWVRGQAESVADDLEFFIPTLGSKIRTSS